MSTILSWNVYTFTTHKMLEHCNLMSMYIYSKSKIYFSECNENARALMPCIRWGRSTIGHRCLISDIRAFWPHCQYFCPETPSNTHHSWSDFMTSLYIISLLNDMMRQTNDCSPIRVMQHKVKYFLYIP